MFVLRRFKSPITFSYTIFTFFSSLLACFDKWEREINTVESILFEEFEYGFKSLGRFFLKLFFFFSRINYKKIVKGEEIEDGRKKSRWD